MSPPFSKKSNLCNRRKDGVKILVVTGASGGHIFPALSFLDALKDRYKDVDTLLALPKRSQKYNIIPDNYNAHYISIANIKLSFDSRFFFDLLKFFKGSLESLILILGFRPDAVVGFGSLVSIPLVLLAWIFRIRTLIHEQNVIPGRANRFLAKFSDRIAISFEETKNYFKGSSRKVVFTGNPIRREFKRIDKNKALDFFGLSSDGFTILVMGGSIGSHSINTGFASAISKIRDKAKFQIIHLIGYKDYDLLKNSYKDLGINARLFNFLKEMEYAYSVCDLVICRAGATTVTEIIFFGLPAIIIPYPLAYQHQVSNARFLENKGCAIIIKDSELDNGIFSQTIEDLIKNPDKIRNMRANYNNISLPKADDLLVDEVMSLN